MQVGFRLTTSRADRARVDHVTGNDRPPRHPAWISRVRARARSSRGVAVVEAAFVTPIFLMLILGVFEGGLFMKDYLGMANATRAGARTASAAGKSAQADLYTVLNISREIAALNRSDIQYVVIYNATGFGVGPVDEDDGLVAGCLSGTPITGKCNVYRPSDFTKAVAQVKEESRHAAAVTAGQTSDVLDQSKVWFGCLTEGPHAGASPDRFWCPTVREDRRSGNGGRGPDFVGIYIKVRHEWVTHMFGSGRDMDDQSVIRIEPRQL